MIAGYAPREMSHIRPDRPAPSPAASARGAAGWTNAGRMPDKCRTGVGGPSGVGELAHLVGLDDLLVLATFLGALGALEGVDAAFGIHVWSDVPTGHVAVRTGPMMAAGDHFEIEVFGKAGHGAMPHCCADATLMASAIALNLQTVVSRETDPIDTAVGTVGMLESGTRFNVVSGYAKLVGTTRCFKPESRARFPEQLERIARETARAMKGDAKLTYNELIPPTINDADMAERVRVAAKKLLGEDALYDYPPSMGGEDFANYQEKVPGAMCFLGVRNEACGAVYAQHHNCYQVDEAMLVKGALLHAQMAVDYLGLECQ